MVVASLCTGAIGPAFAGATWIGVSDGLSVANPDNTAYIPPQSAFNAATAAIPAVSVRKMRGPIVSAIAP